MKFPLLSAKQFVILYPDKRSKENASAVLEKHQTSGKTRRVGDRRLVNFFLYTLTINKLNKKRGLLPMFILPRRSQGENPPRNTRNPHPFPCPHLPSKNHGRRPCLHPAANPFPAHPGIRKHRRHSRSRVCPHNCT